MEKESICGGLGCGETKIIWWMGSHRACTKCALAYVSEFAIALLEGGSEKYQHEFLAKLDPEVEELSDKEIEEIRTAYAAHWEKGEDNE